MFVEFFRNPESPLEFPAINGMAKAVPYKADGKFLRDATKLRSCRTEIMNDAKEKAGG